MREDFLHYLWKHGKFENTKLNTTQGEVIQIFSVGEHNLNAGPDFFNVKLSIAGQLWAGNLEIHIKSSDWYVHHHEKDIRYNNVVLHVVWQDDMVVFRKDESIIPTLELKRYVSEKLISNYETLLKREKKFINCEKNIRNINRFILNNWKERLYIERLEQKSKPIFKELEASKNDWEATLFRMLAKNFGLTVNGDAFYEMAKMIPFDIIRKIQHDALSLEALLFGVSGLLKNDNDVENVYQKELLERFNFLKRKFSDIKASQFTPKFFRLRPNNFPTIRLSQLAMVYTNYRNVFSKLILSKNIEETFVVLNVRASDYWETHYTFGKTSAYRKKNVSKEFISLLIINTIIPLQFCYARYKGDAIDEELIARITALPAEKNQIIEKFKALKLELDSAIDSQALLQLYRYYCTQNQCLHCAIGNAILKS
ncbi:DUF2851 family protein [Flavobacteriaceae bacterium R38]|nr:DUF2851 family protein [Flavobacteriaceae bacterium R38]